MKILACSLALTLVAGVASAGGLAAPVIAPEPAPPSQAYVMVNDWSGSYLGLHYGRGSDMSGRGLHAGYIWDRGAYTLGAEVDYTDLDGDMLRLRSRAGYDLGRVLPYASLGLARFSTGGGDTQTGYSYGLGVVFKLTDAISIGADLSRTSLGDTNDDIDLLQIRTSYRF